MIFVSPTEAELGFIDEFALRIVLEKLLVGLEGLWPSVGEALGLSQTQGALLMKRVSFGARGNGFGKVFGGCGKVFEEQTGFPSLVGSSEKVVKFWVFRD